MNIACRVSSRKLPLPTSSGLRLAALQIALRTQALPSLPWLHDGREIKYDKGKGENTGDEDSERRRIVYHYHPRYYCRAKSRRVSFIKSAIIPEGGEGCSLMLPSTKPSSTVNPGMVYNEAPALYHTSAKQPCSAVLPPSLRALSLCLPHAEQIPAISLQPDVIWIRVTAAFYHSRINPTTRLLTETLRMCTRAPASRRGENVPIVGRCRDEREVRVCLMIRGD